MRQTLLSYLPDFLDRGEDTALMGRSGLRTVYWSYSRLARTSFQVARELASRGLGQGDRLLLREDNSPEWVATFLGCLMRGVVVVPLDAQSSPEFIAGVERQTRPKIVLGGNPAPHPKTDRRRGIRSRSSAGAPPDTPRPRTGVTPLGSLPITWPRSCLPRGPRPRPRGFD